MYDSDDELSAVEPQDFSGNHLNTLSESVNYSDSETDEDESESVTSEDIETETDPLPSNSDFEIINQETNNEEMNELFENLNIVEGIKKKNSIKPSDESKDKLEIDSKTFEQYLLNLANESMLNISGC